MKKNPTADERRHMGRVAELGCILCRELGLGPTPAQVHHIRAGTGGGRRSSHYDTLPLCYDHHAGKTGVHGLGTKGFVKHYGLSEHDLLDRVRRLLEGPTLSD